MRNLLYIAYYFPPLGGAGVQRTLKFVKYLPDFGWQPHILTVLPATGYILDTSLNKDVPYGITVTQAPDPLRLDKMAAWIANLPGVWALLERLRTGKPGNPREYIRSLFRRYAEMPDAQSGWARQAYPIAKDLIRSQTFDAMISTSLPYSDHLLALKLKRDANLPWLADFRDEWSQNPYLEHFTPYHPWQHRRLEMKVLFSADQVVSVSEPITQNLCRPGMNPLKFHTITNGYDGSDFDASLRAIENLNPNNAAPFTITYVGSLYGMSTPLNLIRAIEGLLDQGLLLPSEIRLRLIGRMGSFSFRKPEWKSVLETTGYMEHTLAIQELMKAHILLLIIPNERGSGAYTGKIFEYLATGKPILALVPTQGVAAQLITECQSGWIVDPDNVAEIQKNLQEIISRWKSNLLKIPYKTDIVKKYERRNLTAHLATLLDKMCN